MNPYYSVFSFPQIWSIRGGDRQVFTLPRETPFQTVDDLVRLLNDERRKWTKGARR